MTNYANIITDIVINFNLDELLACRSCSAFFIEHDNKFSAAFVVLEDNCPTRPTSFFQWKIESGKWKIVLNNFQLSIIHFQFRKGRVQFFAPNFIEHLNNHVTINLWTKYFQTKSIY